tara:strand:+ start:3472 stop:4560 length:1089 start_codon:yes stop_codon:yes gene_type:complete
MRIGILGTRGIPNFYGGFEQFAQYLSEGLVNAGHDVFVYNSHLHPYKEKSWNGVNLVHCYDPEEKIGTAGQFIYDLNCILDSRKRDLDIILQLGYTSSSVWNWLFPKNVPIITNMDGLEWKRSKYSKPVQSFLKFAEKLAVLFSDQLIADSKGIQSYLKEKYNKDSVYIPYGANVFSLPDESVLKNYSLTPFNYDMLIARLEPENSVEEILDGFVASNVKRDFLVIGNTKTPLGKKLVDKYQDSRIKFVGYIKGIDNLDSLRYFSNLYFHGHSVGGTNPSLLEAMASNAFICAHDNIFNKAILDDDAVYFSSAEEVRSLVESILKKKTGKSILSNIEKVSKIYAWETIISQYEVILKDNLKK